jgi:hypothetical protein
MRLQPPHSLDPSQAMDISSVSAKKNPLRQAPKGIFQSASAAEASGL